MGMGKIPLPIPPQRSQMTYTNDNMSWGSQTQEPSLLESQMRGFENILQHSGSPPPIRLPTRSTISPATSPPASPQWGEPRHDGTPHTTPAHRAYYNYDGSLEDSLPVPSPSRCFTLSRLPAHSGVALQAAASLSVSHASFTRDDALQVTDE